MTIHIPSHSALPDMPWEPCTGAGEAEDRRWRRWGERCASHLGALAHNRETEEIAWSLYCDGEEPAKAAAKIRRMLRD